MYNMASRIQALKADVSPREQLREVPVEKLQILLNGEKQRELELTKRELVIGRDLNSDIHLDDPSVSRRHALLTRVFSDYFIEDLSSTNGTQLNDRSIRKHILKSGDRLEIGSFELRYDKTGSGIKDDSDKTVVIRPEKVKAGFASASSAKAKIRPMPNPIKPSRQKATLEFVEGPAAGRVEPLERSLSTVGRPGEKIAVIARRPEGFYLLNLGGEFNPKVDGRPVGRGGSALNDGDVIEVGEHRMKITVEKS